MNDEPAQNKMMTGAAKRWFHFSGDGIYHNLTIIAQSLEEATKQWLEKRRTIAVAPEAAPKQSTPAPEMAPESEVQLP